MVNFAYFSLFVMLCLDILFFTCIFSMLTFYKMSNLDNRIANADQLLTQV